jgi:predicted MPP superfamily phosphohydrolase
MPRAASLAIFISIALSIAGLVHWYVWLRLVSAPALPLPYRRGLTAAFVLLFGLIPLTFYFSRVGDLATRRLTTFPGYVWMGLVFILFTLVAGVDVVRLIGFVVQRLVADVPPADPERRITAARLLATAIALVGGGAAVASLRSGLGPVVVKEVRIRLDRLPKSMHGTTIVQLSDIHVGPTIGRDFIEGLVAQVNALAPDLVAITGDLVDGSVSTLRDQVAPLTELRSRFGTFFVTGNHEYYSGTESWCRELTAMGLRVLRNERVSIGDGANGFDLAGIDDHEARRFGGKSDLATALEGRDESRELVLLAHQPRAGFEADRHGVGLQLSGHTHGGQIWPWKYFVYLQQPIVAGLGRIGRTLVYVSSGTGYWGPPMRLHAPAEITKIILESSAA